MGMKKFLRMKIDNFYNSIYFIQLSFHYYLIKLHSIKLNRLKFINLIIIYQNLQN